MRSSTSQGRVRKGKVVRTSESKSPRCRAEIPGLGRGADPRVVADVLADAPPSFFVVGAPRCGTTAISKALGRNPHISFSKPKETHFFLREYDDLSREEVRRQYLEGFHPDLRRDSQAIGDGSVSYLYFSEAISRALAFDGRARFIASVRNPLDMLRSYHARLLFSLDEDIVDFSEAWALQEERAAGGRLPKRCRDPRLLMYGPIGRLGEQIARLFAVAGRERCHVVVFDDLVQEPRAVYQRLLAFLGVDDDGQTGIKRARESAGFKSRWLQQFVMNPPQWAFRLIDVGDAKMLRRLNRLRKAIKKFNRAPEQRQDLSEGMGLTMRRYFAADVQKLSALLDRDLTHWLR